MADSMSIDAIRSLMPANGEVAAQVQIFALKQVQAVQANTMLALIQAAEVPSPSPVIPHLGSVVDTTA